MKTHKVIVVLEIVSDCESEAVGIANGAVDHLMETFNDDDSLHTTWVNPNGDTLVAATYDYRHGTDMFICWNADAVTDLRNEIGEENFEHVFPDEEKPPFEEVGERYFERQGECGDEFLWCDPCKILF